MTTHPRSRWGQNRPLSAPIALSPTLFSWNRATSEVEGAFPVSFALSSSHCSSFIVPCSNCICSPLLQRGWGESFSRPLYILYNKVYPPLSQLLLSVLPSFFLFFLKIFPIPLQVCGKVIPLHSQNGNTSYEPSWRMFLLRYEERVLWQIFIDRNCSTGSVHVLLICHGG